MYIPPSRILIVEDDLAAMSMLAQYLRGAGYEICCSASIAQARRHLRHGHFDLLLLDIHLPDGDGLALALELRERSTAGIIFVTRRADDVDRILALETAADDYVTKPVHLRELLARVRALLRRCQSYRDPAPPETVLTFDRWLIDLRRRELALRDGAVLPLTPREFDLLAVLVMARGETQTRDYLLEVVSKRERTVDARTVDTLVARLRRKLAQASALERSPIRTVVGIGYRLDAEVGSGA